MTLAALVAAPAVHAAPVRTLAHLADASAVGEYRGRAIVSAYDRPTERYRLTLVERDGTRRRLPVIVQGEPFDADIGPGPDGAPTVVYARDGRLWRLRIGAARPYAIAGANTRAGLSSPTIWRRRLAYVRNAHDDPEVLVRGLAWPPSRPSVHRPAAPSRACAGSCRTADRSVDELELRGHTLALLTGFAAEGLDDGGQQVRVDDTVSAASRAIAETGNGGLGGHVIGALSFADGWLAWRHLCTGDPGGCSGAQGAARARVRRGHLLQQSAAGRYVPMYGFALTHRGSLQVVTRGELGLDDPGEPCDGPGPDDRCPLVRTGALHWTR